MLYHATHGTHPSTNSTPFLKLVGELLKNSNILKLTDFIKYKFALFIRNSLRKENIPIFNEFYPLFNQTHA